MKKMIIMTVLAAGMTFVGCNTIRTDGYPDTMHAVIIGTGYQCDKKELRKDGADLDITTMTELVTSKYGMDQFLRENYKCSVLKDKYATVNNVKTMMRIAIQSDLAVIYFSCRAGQVPTSDPFETDGLDEYVKLYDGNLVDNEIWEILKEAKGRVLIIFETDYANSMFRTSNDTEPPVMFSAEEDPGIDMLCWTACSETETLPERGVGSKMTNTIYFKRDIPDTYRTLFDKVMKKVPSAGRISFGTNFEDMKFLR